jgi:hypothetical protein
VRRGGKQYTYLRCRSRRLTPGTLASNNHPDNIAIAEVAVQGPLHEWLAGYFDEDRLEMTVDALLTADGVPSLNHVRRDKVRSQLREAGARRNRLMDAIEAGHIDAASVADRLAAVHQEIDALTTELEVLGSPTDERMTREGLQELIAGLGSVARKVFDDGQPASLARLYEDLGLSILYDAEERVIEVTANFNRSSADSWGYVRAPGGTRTPNLLLRTESLFH